MDESTVRANAVVAEQIHLARVSWQKHVTRDADKWGPWRYFNGGKSRPRTDKRLPKTDRQRLVQSRSTVDGEWWMGVCVDRHGMPSGELRRENLHVLSVEGYATFKNTILALGEAWRREAKP